MYNYLVYGLKVSSEILLPFIEIDKHNEVDVTIGYGEALTLPDGLYLKTNDFAYNSEFAFVQVLGLCSFYIQNGSNIIVVVEAGIEINECAIRQYISCNMIFFILMQRGYLTLHGSAINYKDSCVCFCGHSGAGKSSLTKTICDNGYELMVDDLIGIDAKGVLKPIAYGPRQRRIKSDGIHHFGYKESEVEALFGVEGKYVANMRQPSTHKDLPLVMIVELNVAKMDKPYIEEVSGIEKIRLIINHTYKSIYYSNRHMIEQVFKSASVVANVAKVYKLYRPEVGYTMDQQMALVMSCIEVENDNGIIST